MLKATNAADFDANTDDVFTRIAGRYDRLCDVFSVDVCPAMLAIAKRKAATRRLSVDFRVLDAHLLKEIADESVDAYVISFGMKICDRAVVLREALRVLRPGGTLYCLEASRIPVPLVHAAYLKYMDWCLPLIARIATDGDRGAYNYLLRGIHDFPGAPALAREMEAFGFANISYRYLTFGIVALHVARKPSGVAYS